MKIEEYLKDKGMSLNQLCKVIGYTRQQLYNVRTGKIKPSKKLMKALFDYTHGEITKWEG